MTRTLRSASESAEHAVAVVFNSIRSAAMFIEAVDPRVVLESWDRQDATMPITDPTTYQAILAARDDMRCKRQIIEAADRFLQQWNRIKAEALDAVPPSI